MSILRSRERVLEEMGLGPGWLLHAKSTPAEEPAIAAPDTVPATQKSPVAIPASVKVAAPIATPPPKTAPAMLPGFANWEELAETIKNCTRCCLCETRTNTVPGVGDTRAEWLFIGEGPGYHEDQQGEPFVGRSGMLLDNMLAALSIKRGHNAYIANIVKCRASDERKKDRQPTEEEAATCMPYLQWQIAAIRPKVIVALGKTAAVGLLNTDRDITMAAMRGKIHRLPVNGVEIPLVVTYHPAYLLRTPMAKKQAWADLCLAMDVVEQSQ